MKCIFFPMFLGFSCFLFSMEDVYLVAPEFVLQRPLKSLFEIELENVQKEIQRLSFNVDKLNTLPSSNRNLYRTIGNLIKKYNDLVLQIEGIKEQIDDEQDKGCISNSLCISSINQCTLLEKQLEALAHKCEGIEKKFK